MSSHRVKRSSTDTSSRALKKTKVLTELGPNDNDSEPRLTRLSRKVALENAHKNKRAGCHPVHLIRSDL